MKKVHRMYTGVYYYRSKVKKDRSWYIVYKVKGKKKTEKVGWDSEGMTASIAASIRQARIISGHPDRMTATFYGAFKEYQWSIFECSQERKATNWNRYDKHIHKAIGHMKLNEIGYNDIRNICEKLIDKLHRSTIQKYVQLIKGTYKHMERDGGYTGINPTKFFTLHSEKRDRERYLGKNEAKQLLDALKHQPDLYLQTLLSLLTGMRLSEVMAMRYSHINYEDGIIYVEGKGRFGMKKSRTVEMNAQVAGALKEYTDTTWEFGKLFDKPFRRKAWDKVVKDLGFNGGSGYSKDRKWRVTFHTLRHTFGSWLAQSGTAPQIIQQLMGHESVVTTMRYAKLGRRAGTKHVEKLVV